MQDYEIKIAIIGGGISGLGAAINLSRVPGVTVNVYEKASELREIGGGLTIGPHTRNILHKSGVHLKVNGHNVHPFYHLNGSDGKVLYKQESYVRDPWQQHDRIRRTDLHSALRKSLPRQRLHLDRKLSSISQDTSTAQLLLNFEKGQVEKADLIVGADGVRSIVREFAFPEATLEFIGVVAYRAILPLSRLKSITAWDVSKTTSWYLPKLVLFYTIFDGSNSDENRCEIVLRTQTDPNLLTPAERSKLNPVSWGVDVDNRTVGEIAIGFEPTVQHLLSCVPEGGWRKYAAFTPPRLPRTIQLDKIVLIGDAAHPMSGSYGSGATFGLEDGWVLSKAVQSMLRLKVDQPLKEALNVYDRTRVPYYEQLQVIQNQGWEAAWINIAQWLYSPQLGWIYYNQVEAALAREMRPYEERKVLSHDERRISAL